VVDGNIKYTVPRDCVEAAKIKCSSQTHTASITSNGESSNVDPDCLLDFILKCNNDIPDVVPLWRETEIPESEINRPEEKPTDAPTSTDQPTTPKPVIVETIPPGSAENPVGSQPLDSTQSVIATIPVAEVIPESTIVVQPGSTEPASIQVVPATTEAVIGIEPVASSTPNQVGPDSTPVVQIVPVVTEATTIGVSPIPESTPGENLVIPIETPSENVVPEGRPTSTIQVVPVTTEAVIGIEPVPLSTPGEADIISPVATQPEVPGKLIGPEQSTLPAVAVQTLPDATASDQPVDIGVTPVTTEAVVVETSPTQGAVTPDVTSVVITPVETPGEAQNDVTSPTSTAEVQVVSVETPGQEATPGVETVSTPRPKTPRNVPVASRPPVATPPEAEATLPVLQTETGAPTVPTEAHATLPVIVTPAPQKPMVTKSSTARKGGGGGTRPPTQPKTTTKQPEATTTTTTGAPNVTQPPPQGSTPQIEYATTPQPTVLTTSIPKKNKDCPLITLPSISISGKITLSGPKRKLHQLSDIWNSAKEMAAKAADSAKAAASKTADAAKAAAAKAASIAKNAVSDSVKAVNDMKAKALKEAEDMKKAAVKKTEELEAAAKKKVDEVKASAVKTAKAAQAKVEKAANAAKKKVADVKKAAEKKSAELKEAAEKAAKQAIKDAEVAAKAAVDKAKKLQDDAIKSAKTAAQSAEKVVGSAAKSVANAAKNAADDTLKVMKEMKEKAEKEAKALKEAAEKKAKELKDAAVKAAKEAEEKAAKLAKEALAKAEATAKKAKLAAEKAAKDALAKAEKLKDEAKKKAAQAVEDAKKAAAKVVKNVNQQVDKVGKEVNDVVKAAQKAGKDAAADVKSAVGKLGKSVDGIVDEGKKLGADAIKSIEKSIDDGKKLANDAVKDIKTIGGEAINDAKNFGAQVAKDAKNISGKALSDVKKLGGEAIDDLEKMGKEAISDIKQIGGEALDKVQNAVVQVSRKTWNDAKKTYENVVEDVKVIGGKAIRKTWNSAKNAYEDVVEDVKVVGSKMIRKTWNEAKKQYDEVVEDIKENYNAAEKAVANAVKAVANAVKDIELIGGKAVKNVWNEAKKQYEQVAVDVKSLSDDAKKALKNAVQDIQFIGGKAVRTVWNEAKQTFEQVTEDISKIGGKMFTKVWNEAKQSYDTILEDASKVLAKMKEVGEKTEAAILDNIQKAAKQGVKALSYQAKPEFEKLYQTEGNQFWAVVAEVSAKYRPCGIEFTAAVRKKIGNRTPVPSTPTRKPPVIEKPEEPRIPQKNCEECRKLCGPESLISCDECEHSLCAPITVNEGESSCPKDYLFKRVVARNETIHGRVTVTYKGTCTKLTTTIIGPEECPVGMISQVTSVDKRGFGLRECVYIREKDIIYLGPRECKKPQVLIHTQTDNVITRHCETPPFETASAWGDPHFKLFNGREFSYMFVGDVLMLKTLDDQDPFELQLRMHRYEGMYPTVVSGIAMRLNKETVVSFVTDAKEGDKLVDRFYSSVTKKPADYDMKVNKAWTNAELEKVKGQLHYFSGSAAMLYNGPPKLLTNPITFYASNGIVVQVKKYTSKKNVPESISSYLSVDISVDRSKVKFVRPNLFEIENPKETFRKGVSSPEDVVSHPVDSKELLFATPFDKDPYDIKREHDHKRAPGEALNAQERAETDAACDVFKDPSVNEDCRLTYLNAPDDKRKLFPEAEKECSPLAEDDLRSCMEDYLYAPNGEHLEVAMSHKENAVGRHDFIYNQVGSLPPKVSVVAARANAYNINLLAKSNPAVQQVHYDSLPQQLPKTKGNVRAKVIT
jgi:DNA repair exonuclease SbcCD ATPase subunit